MMRPRVSPSLLFIKDLSLFSRSTIFSDLSTSQHLSVPPPPPVRSVIQLNGLFALMVTLASGGEEHGKGVLITCNFSGCTSMLNVAVAPAEFCTVNEFVVP